MIKNLLDFKAFAGIDIQDPLKEVLKGIAYETRQDILA
jgi:hypothetical protein